MACNAFLDTNIIIDLLDPLRPSHEESMHLFSLLEQEKFKGYYSESVVTTTAYVIRKDYPKNKICEIIESLNKRIILLPCESRDIKEASRKLPPDFEDALLYEIALHHELDYFITSNTKEFKTIQKATLPVINAKAFNKILE
ncbi:MAG: type II toxin-antitoxin system VapC family toxin [Ginsengibacter sp.]